MLHSKFVFIQIQSYLFRLVTKKESKTHPGFNMQLIKSKVRIHGLITKDESREISDFSGIECLPILDSDKSAIKLITVISVLKQ